MLNNNPMKVQLSLLQMYYHETVKDVFSKFDGAYLILRHLARSGSFLQNAVLTVPDCFGPGYFDQGSIRYYSDKPIVLYGLKHEIIYFMLRLIQQSARGGPCQCYIPHLASNVC